MVNQQKVDEIVAAAREVLSLQKRISDAQETMYRILPTLTKEEVNLYLDTVMYGGKNG